MGAMASRPGRRLAAIDRATTALRDWIADERTAAEQRHPDATDEDALEAAVLDDPVYRDGLAAWHAATEALRAVRPLMAPAPTPDGQAAFPQARPVTTVEGLERELDAIVAKRHPASWGDAAAEREYVDRLKARVEAARQTPGQCP